MDADPLDQFSPATQAWFRGSFAAPTAVQTQAWASIAAGRHTLVVAPTGSGKTLAAFLWALDRLGATPPASEQRRCRVLYVSPLKALAVDVERNLHAPLVGVRAAAERLGVGRPEVTVAVRSGDTPADERRRFARTPSDILITTPESLFLMLTSSAREALRGVETVILDEVHAVAGTKRGAHLAVSLDRLDALLAAPAQRIGLSATVRPVDEVARFLAGGRPVEVVAPPADKQWELSVVVPVPDLADIGAASGDLTGAAAGDVRRTSVWPHVEEKLVDLIEQHRSTLIFANSRRLAERLTSRLNEIAGERASGVRGDGSVYDQQVRWYGSPLSQRTRAEAPAVEGGPGALQGADGHGDRLRRRSERSERRRDESAGGASARVSKVAERPSGQAVPGGKGTSAGNPTTSPFNRAPAEVMGQAGASSGAPPVVARAHHGSISREQRAQTEEDLKAGRLPAVVATSSLELGIDMGAIDLVVQVESPPSVASALQRVGRAGHQVGAVSRGVFFPKYRGDLVATTVVAERMRVGAIEELAVVANPLDVAAQQIVAMVAMDDWSGDDLLTLLRRSAPFATLTRAVLDAVLDMLSGRYPSDAFAELRPRLVWNRDTDVLTGRRGAQRIAVTSGGTIPDRGLYGVFIAGEGSGRRVGELDEEMVYESREGDVITLGTTSWRIERITADQVLVTPAAGEPGRLPFWKGDSLGRPIELGRAQGTFLREVAGASEQAARERLTAAGLDGWASDNLLGYLDEQRAATGHVPTDRLIVVERFTDELGDWRVVIHTPFGARVHAPWALAIGARLRERFGFDAQVMHADDGIVVRLPDLGQDAPPSLLDEIVLDPDDVRALVTDEIGGSALFASRFRECAGRALLLPRRHPGKRQPLWQQRQRSAQLLAVASEFPEFPIVLEAVRECLTDVFDLPGLVELMRDIAARRVRVVEVGTPTPSPFASSLLFGYVAQFLYNDDQPLAEKRAAALTLDPGLLAELLGTSEGLGLRDLLSLDAITRTQNELQHLVEGRRARDADEVTDLLRALGPLSEAEIAERSVGFDAAWLARLVNEGRVYEAGVGGVRRFVAIEDAGRLAEALGVPAPLGVPEAFLDAGPDPLLGLVARFARTHGPFPVAALAERFGLGPAVARDALRRLGASGRVVEGEFTPGASGREFCDAGVLRTIRRRSVAALRAEIEPASPADFARFVPAWQEVVGTGLRGVDGVLRAVEQLAGVVLPASALESLILPARVRDYAPAMLDELCASGEVTWRGHGALSAGDGWISLWPAGLPRRLAEPEPVEGAVEAALLEALHATGASFFSGLASAVGDPTGRDAAEALWNLVWAGLVTNDTLNPLRARLTAGATTHKVRAPAPRGRYGRPRTVRLAVPPAVGGRWSLLPPSSASPTEALVATCEVLLDRYGVVTRGFVGAEQIEGGFSAVYRVLAQAEEAGRVRRGYFVEGLGAAQFAGVGAIDRLRGVRPWGPDAPTIVLAASDPANPWGAALPWPPTAGTHRPARKAGALVVLTDGQPTVYLERGGRTALVWASETAELREAADALAALVHTGRLDSLTLERIDGEPVLGSAHPLVDALVSAGFHLTPKGVRLRR